MSLALYIDLENLPSRIDFDLLMKRLLDDTGEGVFAAKTAYGSASQISEKLRVRLTELSVRLVDTPHVCGKKNRADLIISVDAFERLHVAVPPIDRFVFVTSDSDFSVIMDRLRSYGKQVWLVCRKDDQHQKLLSESCDRMIHFDDLTPVRPAAKIGVDAGRPGRVLEEALRQVGPGGLPLSLSELGSMMKRIDKSFSYRGCVYKCLTDLAGHYERSGLLRLGRDAKGAIRVEDMDDSRLTPIILECPPPSPGPCAEEQPLLEAEDEIPF